MPSLWIVAGPNGAGKTTLVASGVVRRIAGPDLLSLNADQRTAEILAANPCTPDANLQAAIEIDAEFAACIEQGDDVLVETVLSSDKYVDDIERAIALGYRFGLIYVGLVRPEASILRVHQRREHGGHDVPEDRIVQRWSRSIAMLGRIVDYAHEMFVYDNSYSTRRPVLIAHKADGQIVILHPNRIPEIDAVLIANGAITP